MNAKPFVLQELKFPDDQQEIVGKAFNATVWDSPDLQERKGDMKALLVCTNRKS